MTVTKMYTAILNCNGINKVKNISVSPNREEAQEEVKRKYPDHELVALVPGNHASWTKVFQPDEEIFTQRKLQNAQGSIKEIDVWALPFDLPTE